MKIVIDGRNISSTTGRYIRQLLTHLAKIDSQNQYTVLVKPKEVKSWQPTQANFRLLTAPMDEYTYGEQLGLTKLLYRLKPDLVHFTLPQHPILYFRPFVITIHDLTMINYINRRQVNPLASFVKYRLKPQIFKLVLWHGVKFSKYILVPSKSTKRQILEQFKVKANKIIVTYESADKLANRPQLLAKLKNKQFLLYVGNAFPYKNLENLLLAFKEVVSNKPDLYLVMAGKQDYFHHQLAAFAKQQQINHVIFTGFISDGQLAWLYNQAQAYVFPSLSEGFGLPGLEAMQYGLPVLAAKATSLPEIYGPAAVYFDPHDINEMAQTILKVLDNPAQRQRLATAGKKRLANFSWAKMAQETIKVYRQALGAKD